MHIPPCMLIVICFVNRLFTHQGAIVGFRRGRISGMSGPGVTLDHPDSGLCVVQMWTFLVILHVICMAPANLAQVAEGIVNPIAEAQHLAIAQHSKPPTGPGQSRSVDLHEGLTHVCIAPCHRHLQACISAKVGFLSVKSCQGPLSTSQPYL
jgi:hypothetical protein